MNREFINLEIFNRLWEDLGLTDDNLKELQEHLNIDPGAGKIIKNIGGVRKLRWALKGKGKSSGVRVLYVDFLFKVDELKNELRRKNHEKSI